MKLKIKSNDINEFQVHLKVLRQIQIIINFIFGNEINNRVINQADDLIRYGLFRDVQENL